VQTNKRRGGASPQTFLQSFRRRAALRYAAFELT
jgi:hypothetical protein